MSRLLSWPSGALALIAVALPLFAAPSRFEGPVLVPISPGHGLARLDTVALLPLLLGIAWLYAGLWTRRQRLISAAVSSPGRGGIGVFLAGAGLGLLLASSFSTFFWWWAIGAALFGAMVLAAVVVAAGR